MPQEQQRERARSHGVNQYEDIAIPLHRNKLLDSYDDTAQMRADNRKLPMRLQEKDYNKEIREEQKSTTKLQAHLPCKVFVSHFCRDFEEAHLK